MAALRHSYCCVTLVRSPSLADNGSCCRGCKQKDHRHWPVNSLRLEIIAAIGAQSKLHMLRKLGGNDDDLISLILIDGKGEVQ